MTKAAWTELLRVVANYRRLGVCEEDVWWFVDGGARFLGFHDVDDACLCVAKDYLETLTGYRESVWP